MEIHSFPQLGTNWVLELGTSTQLYPVRTFQLPDTFIKMWMVQKMRAAREAREFASVFSNIENSSRSIEIRNWVLNWVLNWVQVTSCTQLHCLLNNFFSFYSFLTGQEEYERTK
jgi:hypothetical protein